MEEMEHMGQAEQIALIQLLKIQLMQEPLDKVMIREGLLNQVERQQLEQALEAAAQGQQVQSLQVRLVEMQGIQ